MNNFTSKLDEKLTLRSGITLPNRIAMAPLTNNQSNSDGTLHEDEFQWLTKRAGNFGLISTCAAFVSQEGRAWEGQLGISNDKHLPGLVRFSEALIKAGSVPIIQLHHAGIKAELAQEKISTIDSGDARGATQSDIERIICDFTLAAQRAEHAGFMGVEVHGANGYLFTQFLSPQDNPRDDLYGGNLEGRARFLRQTVQSIRNATSSNFMISVRISPLDTWDHRGLLISDSIKLAQWLTADGVDIIHLSLKDASGPPPFEKNVVPVVRSIRDAIPNKVKIAVAGGIRTREDARKAESAGADIVVIGKASIVHPDWPRVSKSNDFVPISAPWDPNYLHQVSVGPKFVKYLQRIPGLVLGGMPSKPVRVQQ
ncbi:MAG: NADPH dehydrogenase [Candidatus Heimdallarchaeota archaeon LC_2]|nr:MAG: NADPH dehydrogenase [Candidatus Heimdallarchaeota archaeon LC_2]